MTTLMPIDVQSAFSWAPKVARKCESKHWYACGADGRSGGRSVYGHVITKFSRMGSLPHFVTHGAPLRASRARAPLLRLQKEVIGSRLENTFQNHEKEHSGHDENNFFFYSIFYFTTFF